MASDARYSALEHGGLELSDKPAKPDQGGLEVASPHAQGGSAPEVVPGSNSRLDRRSSLNQPETLHPGQYDVDPNAPSPEYNSADPYYAGTKPSYLSPDASKEQMTASSVTDGKAPPNRGRRYCGMSKKVFIIVIVVAAVVLLGAILGGVLGGVLGSKKHNSDDSSDSGSSSGYNEPLEAKSLTGLATAIAPNGQNDTLITYYQDPDGRIIENVYTNNSWNLHDQSDVNNSVVTTTAELSSPLAAISYVAAGQTYRQVFFINSGGFIMETNSTEIDGNNTAHSWSTPQQISSEAGAANSLGLTACTDNATDGMDGIRLYYGLDVGGVQELGYNFSDPKSGWVEWYWFSPSNYSADSKSGVACTTIDSGEDRIVNVYFFNTTSQRINQWFYDYSDTDNTWQQGPTANLTAKAGTDIAACNDGSQTEYVFYQLPDGTVTRGVTQPLGEQFSEFDPQQYATNGSKIAANYIAGGAAYLFQNETQTSDMWLVDNSRSGQTITNIAVT